MKQNQRPNDVLLFSPEALSPWISEWKDMPEYQIEDLEPRYQVIVNFAHASDLEEFGKLIGQKIKANSAARQLQSFWFPEQEIGRLANKRYISLL